MKNPIQMIKQCVEKEEPYFVLRGQDVCALAAIETYYEYQIDLWQTTVTRPSSK